MILILLIISTVISTYCGWVNYFQAEKYKKQRNMYKKKFELASRRETHEAAIMLTAPNGVFHPERQN